jgi:predicted PurR-regulated permease PerM
MEPTGQPRVYTIIFFVVAVAGVGALSFQVLRPFLAAIAWAIILAVGFNAPWGYLERHMPNHRGLAAGLLSVAIGIVVLAPAGVLVGVLVSQAVDAATRVSNTLQAEHVNSFSDFIALPAVAGFLDEVKAKVGISPADFRKLAGGFVAQASKFAAGLSGKLVLGLFDAVLTFLMAVFLLFFLFRDGREMAAAALDMLPVLPETRVRMGRSLGTMLEAIFRGSLLCSLLQGLSGAIGWWIAGLPSPALAGAGMAVFSLLPIGGTAIIWLPGGLYLLGSNHTAGGVFLLIWGAVVTSFLADNVLRPILIGGAEELSTLVVFLGVFGGLATFGLLGIFIGPIALALATTLLGALRTEASAAHLGLKT